MRASSFVSSGFVFASLALMACGVVGSGFDDASGAETPNTASGGSDDTVENVDAGGGSFAPPSGDAGTKAGGPQSPLCGDVMVCSPDDPRSVPGCNNVSVDAGALGGSSSGGASGGDPAPEDLDAEVDDAAAAARPGACRVAPGSAGATNECKDSGNGGEGAACKVGTDCGAGLDCVVEPGKEAGACRAYCCSGVCAGVVSNAGEGRFCDPAVRTDDQTRIPACLPIHACRLLGKDECGKHQTCAVVRELDGSTGCVEVGKAKVGESCDVEHCDNGLTCLGSVGARTCFQLCSDAGVTCPDGDTCTWAPPAFREAGLGVCIQSPAERLY